MSVSMDELYKIAYELLIGLYKNYNLKDNMILNIPYRSEGDKYIISVKKEEL